MRMGNNAGGFALMRQSTSGAAWPGVQHWESRMSYHGLNSVDGVKARMQDSLLYVGYDV